MMIFKGARNSCIMKYKFPSYIAGSFHECQENTWMDEACMLQWVNGGVKPHGERDIHHKTGLTTTKLIYCHFSGKKLICSLLLNVFIIAQLVQLELKLICSLSIIILLSITFHYKFNLISCCIPHFNCLIHLSVSFSYKWCLW